MAQAGEIGRVLTRIVLCAAIAAPAGATAAEQTAPSTAISVSLVGTPDGLKSTARGSIVIKAPICAVWAVLASCELAPKIVPNVKHCRMIARDPVRGRWEIRELTGGHPLVPKVHRSVVRTDYDPLRRIQFRAVEGDLKFMNGEWVLEAVDDQTTVAIYRAEAVSPVRAPKPLVRIVVRSDTGRALGALREQAQATTCEGARPPAEASELHAAK